MHGSVRAFLHSLTFTMSSLATARCNPAWGLAHGNTHRGRSADPHERVSLQARILTAGVGMPGGSGAQRMNSIVVHSGLVGGAASQGFIPRSSCGSSRLFTFVK